MRNHCCTRSILTSYGLSGKFQILLKTSRLVPLRNHLSTTARRELPLFIGRRRTFATDSSKENENKQEKESSFHWDEFQYRFDKKKNLDYVLLLFCLLPCIGLVLNGTYMLFDMYHSSLPLSKDLYDDIMTIFKNCFIKMPIDETKPMDLEQIKRCIYYVNKLLENCITRQNNRENLASCSELIDKLVKVADLVVNQNMVANDKAEIIYLQYLLKSIYNLTGLIALSEKIEPAQKQHLVDSTLKVISQYTTDIEFMKLSPITFSLITLYELFQRDRSIINYFIEKNGISTLEEFIRERNYLQEKINENLQASNTEAEYLIQQRKFQQDIPIERIRELVKEKDKQNFQFFNEEAAVVILLDSLLPSTEANNYIKNSYVCMKWIVNGLNGENPLTHSSAASALLQLGVPDNPKDRKPLLNNHNLNLMLLNGSASEIIPSAKLNAINFCANQLKYEPSYLIEELEKLLPEAKGTYVEHFINTQIFATLGKVEETNNELREAIEHPSGFGRTDLSLLCFAAERAMKVGDFGTVLHICKDIAALSPRHPFVAEIVSYLCENFEKQILENSAIRDILFSLDQYDACYKIKLLLKDRMSKA
jgi:hypothetical protein